MKLTHYCFDLRYSKKSQSGAPCIESRTVGYCFCKANFLHLQSCFFACICELKFNFCVDIIWYTCFECFMGSVYITVDFVTLVVVDLFFYHFL